MQPKKRPRPPLVSASPITREIRSGTKSRASVLQLDIRVGANISAEVVADEASLLRQQVAVSRVGNPLECGLVQTQLTRLFHSP